MKVSQKSIRCNYSHTPASSCSKKQQQKSLPYTQCPFYTTLSYVEYDYPHKDEIVYKVRVLSITSLEHTCLTSESSYQHGLFTRRGHVKISLDVMTTTVAMLKQDSSLHTKQSQQLLISVLPTIRVIDEKILQGFPMIPNCDNFIE